jgi:signal transduction histidine kinase/CheY-like chemotaxis protein
VPKERILIADDEHDILTLCKRVFERQGYQVTTVDDGYKAIEISQQQKFDLFLTDIQMPGMSGLESAQIIREFQPDLVCVVMTGFGTMERAIQAVKLGFTEFIEKPLNLSTLEQTINHALEKERLRRENTRLNALIPLFELNKTLMTNVDPGKLAQQVLQTACDELGAGMGALMLIDKSQHLNLKASIGIDGDSIPEPMVKELLDDREQVLIHPEESDDGPAGELGRALGVGHLLFNPLLAMDSPVGALVLAKSDSSEEFATGDSELLSVLCGQAAIALQNAQLFDDIQRAYTELQKVDHIKSEFINIAAHELRTPLAILLGHADLLEDEIEEPNLKQRMQTIVRNALRLRELIAALLDMRLLQTGEYPVNIITFDLGELLDDVLQDSTLLIEKKALELTVEIPPDLAPIRSDRQKVHIILGNLVNNAVKFTPSGGRVGIEIKDQGKELWVSVWDTGIGIPQEEFENIFRPFYQVEDSLTREHEGIGLGLSITKDMVELCDGRIWVESQVGKGSRITFTLAK